jgi:hypothetical protein
MNSIRNINILNSIIKYCDRILVVREFIGDDFEVFKSKDMFIV